MQLVECVEVDLFLDIIECIEQFFVDRTGVHCIGNALPGVVLVVRVVLVVAASGFIVGVHLHSDFARNRVNRQVKIQRGRVVDLEITIDGTGVDELKVLIITTTCGAINAQGRVACRELS